MNAYNIVKLVHVSTAAISIVGFVGRFALAWSGSALLRRRALRVLPHINDSLLLGAAVAMLSMARINPLSLSWLSAKIGALLAYILLGMIALRPGRSRGTRLAAFAGALLAFAYIVSAALTRSPLGIFAE